MGLNSDKERDVLQVGFFIINILDGNEVRFIKHVFGFMYHSKKEYIHLVRYIELCGEIAHRGI